MAYITVQFPSESAGNVISSTKWNTNFTNITDGLSNATKDLNMNAITVATLTPTTVGGNPSFTGSPSTTGTLTVNNLISSGPVSAATVTGTNFKATGSAVVGTLTANSLVMTATIATAGTPTANALYGALVPKAWASVASSATAFNGCNLSVSYDAVGSYLYDFNTPMAHTDYAVFGTLNIATASIGFVTIQNRLTTGFFVTIKNSGGTSIDASHNLVVFARQ